MKKNQVDFKDLGLRSYSEVWQFQEELLKGNVNIKTVARNNNLLPGEVNTSHHLLFVEHPPVLTLGKNGNMENLLFSEDFLKQAGIEFFKINRGGDITFHGPGQIVGYPIFDLEKFKTDIGWYLRSIEEVIIQTLATYGIESGRSPGETGVWLDAGIKGRERKICAIGVRCSRWITMHGFALNVNTDLHYFDFIVPCGIVGKQVTSLQKELGRNIDLEEVKTRLKAAFEEVFEVHIAHP